jgi:hypothetical protein
MKKGRVSLCAFWAVCTTLACLLCSTTEAQYLRWTWMQSDSVSRLGTYGARNVWDAQNRPGARSEGTGWVDQDNNFWLFGGAGYDGYWDYGYLNDLWCYSPSRNQWKWVNGYKYQGGDGNYNEKGTFHMYNTPGSRVRSASWTDPDGNLWLFGGEGRATWSSIGLLNDLWMYSISKNEWLWVHGDDLANRPARRGLKGVPHPENSPGGRSDALVWIDKQGAVWLFGGKGLTGAGAGGEFNDLWKYERTINSWTWVHGDSLPNQNPIYGTKGIEGALNVPSSRSGSSGWIDAAGFLWLVSGGRQGCVFDDIWKYNPTTGRWTWIRGTGDLYDHPQGNTTTRYKGENGVGWLDEKGKFWFFGGALEHTLHRLWSGLLSDYDQEKDVWTSNGIFQGVYLSADTSSHTVGPDYREGSVGWTDQSGNLWLFGGWGRAWKESPGSIYYDWDVIGDLWKFTLCRPPAAPVLKSPASALSVCRNESAAITVDGEGDIHWYDKASGGNLLQTGRSFQTPLLQSKTTYFAEAVTCTPSTSRLAVTIDVFPKPPVVAGADLEVCQGASVRLSGAGAASYTWDKGIVNGVSFKPPVGENVYTVTGTDARGCTNTDQVIVLVNPLPQIIGGPDQTICVGDELTLTGSGGSSYTWNNGVTDGTAFRPPTGTTEYIVTGSDVHGCISRDTIRIDVIPPPAVTLELPEIQDFCDMEDAIPLTGGQPEGGVYYGIGVQAGIFYPAIAGPGSHTISYTYTVGNSCSSTAYDTFIVSVCTSTGDNRDNSSGLTLYPNPGNGWYHLNVPGDGNIVILNAMGQAVLDRRWSAEETDLDLRHLPDGVYLLNYFNGAYKSSLRFVIQL